MRDYRKPGKAQANEAYLKSLGIEKDSNPYKEETIEKNKLFLLVCEGENTEPGYFEGFPVPTKTILIKGGRGSKTALVDYALELKKSLAYAEREIWCIFDFDVKPDEAATQLADFNGSILKAEQNGLRTAWSNDAFELWFVLHYQALDARLTRNELYPILKEHWQLESFGSEAKTKKFCQEHYTRLGGTDSATQRQAIKRAETLHVAYGGRQDYSIHCPCTTVYQLVRELNKYCKP
jgi:hypothetical protein